MLEKDLGLEEKMRQLDEAKLNEPLHGMISASMPRKFEGGTTAYNPNIARSAQVHLEEIKIQERFFARIDEEEDDDDESIMGRKIGVKRYISIK